MSTQNEHREEKEVNRKSVDFPGVKSIDELESFLLENPEVMTRVNDKRRSIEGTLLESNANSSHASS